MIDHFSKAAPLEVFCIDDWVGGADHNEFDMEVVEQRFNRNIERAITGTVNLVKVQKCKGRSIEMLAAFLSNGYRDYFDLIFVDGSHEAPDVLGDLVIAYQLCAIGGLIIVDDYLWSDVPHGREDLLAMPRLALMRLVEYLPERSRCGEACRFTRYTFGRRREPVSAHRAVSALGQRRQNRHHDDGVQREHQPPDMDTTLSPHRARRRLVCDRPFER